MELFDYQKIDKELKSINQKICKEYNKTKQKYFDLVTGKSDLYHDTANMIGFLISELKYLRKIVDYTDKVISEIENFIGFCEV